MVAEVDEMAPELTALIAGMDAGVEKVKFAEVALPAESAEITA